MLPQSGGLRRFYLSVCRQVLLMRVAVLVYFGIGPPETDVLHKTVSINTSRELPICSTGVKFCQSLPARQGVSEADVFTMSSLAYKALSVACGLVNMMPIEHVSSIGAVVGRLLGVASKRNSRALANLSMAMPDATAAERKVILRKMWDNFGRTLAETLVAERIAADPARVSITNPEVLDGCGSSGRGAIFVGMHFGNYEMSCVAPLRCGHSPVGLFKPLKNIAANDWLLSQRKRLWPAGILPVSRSALRHVTRVVRDGGALGLLVDHRDSSGLSVPFFGRQAPSVVLPARLAVRYGADIFAVRVDRLPKAHFSITLQRIAVGDSGDAATDELSTTVAIQATLETWIKSDPGSWLWFYKRWSATDSLQPRVQTNVARRNLRARDGELMPATAA